MSRYAVLNGNLVVNVAEGQPPPPVVSVPIPDGVPCDAGYIYTAPSTFTFGQTIVQIDVQNEMTILQQAQQALVNNRAYLAIPSPTQAQAVAQVQALTNQVQGIIRVILNQFDGTN